MERPHHSVTPAAPQLQIPASIGEVIDKITILELKAARLSGERLANVERERELLVGCLEAANLAIAEELVDELRQINAQLWTIEDDIRELESRQEFGDAFIALARAVYVTNDARAAMKRRINERHGSALVEEKLYVDYGSGASGS